MKTKLFCIVLFVFLGTSAILAQPGRVERGRMPFRGQRVEPANGERLIGFLNLTQEQTEAAKKIRLQGAKELKPLKDELRELKAKQQTLTTAAKPDISEINKSIEKIGGVKIEMAKIQAKKQLEFRALLTEEQQLKLDNFKGRMNEPPMRKLPQERKRSW